MPGGRQPRETTQGIPIWRRKRDGYWRADFRRFAHVGGGRESLGSTVREEAERQVSDRLRELERLAEDARLRRTAGDRLLIEFCREHLRAKKSEVGSPRTIQNNDRALRYLIDHMGRGARVSEVDAERLTAFRDARLKRVSPATVNQELSAVSSMLRRAVSWKIVPRNEALHVPGARQARVERGWLEVREAVALLKAAREMETDGRSRCYPHLHALLATFLLTGGRMTEVLGLEAEDLDFCPRSDGRGRVLIRPNRWRAVGSGLKNASSVRQVPLWPQLARILTAHLERTGLEKGLLFPSHIRPGEKLRDVRDGLASAAARAEIAKSVTHHTLRHTYVALRLQTVDAGEPVALYTVAREVGHSGTKQIEGTYGHVLERRVRLSGVRFEPADVIDLASRRQA